MCVCVCAREDLRARILLEPRALNLGSSQWADAEAEEETSLALQWLIYIYIIDYTRYMRAYIHTYIHTYMLTNTERVHVLDEFLGRQCATGVCYRVDATGVCY